MGLHDLTATAQRYEDGVTLGVLVLAVLAFAVLSRVDGRTWWAIRRQRDRTALGRALKWKKLAWAVVAGLLAVLYGMTLIDDLDWWEFGVWWRLTVRLLTLAAAITAAVMGERFYRAYEGENWGLPETAARQAAVGKEQEAVGKEQDATDVRQQAREDRWEARQ